MENTTEINQKWIEWIIEHYESNKKWKKRDMIKSILKEWMLIGKNSNLRIWELADMVNSIS